MDVLHKQQYFVQSFCYIFIYLQLNDLLSLPLDSLYYFYYLSVCNKPCGNNKGVMIRLVYYGGGGTVIQMAPKPDLPRGHVSVFFFTICMRLTDRIHLYYP